MNTKDKNLEWTQEETVATEVVDTPTPEAHEGPDLLDQTPYDQFDWSIGNKHTLSYSEQEIEDYLNLFRVDSVEYVLTFPKGDYFGYLYLSF